MRRVRLITTGGTIASVDMGQGAVPSLSGEELLTSLPNIRRSIDIDVLPFCQVPGHYLTLQQLLNIGFKIEKSIREGVEGVVITMGTNIMEEAAYFLELLLAPKMPVILTGAMRNPSLPGSDGPANLYNAIVSAGSEELYDVGVLVCMNGELHGAEDVAKVHTTSVSAFRSLNRGPVGAVREGRVILYWRPVKRQRIYTTRLGSRVELIKCSADMDTGLFEACLNMGCDGVVIEAFGGGHLIPTAIPTIQKMVEKKVPVVMTSRCLEGELLRDTYGFEGSERHLRRIGVISANALSGQKARIKLILALSAGKNLDEIQRIFEDQ